MRMHVQKTVSCCFAAIRQLRQICRSIPISTFQKLVVALVHSRLDSVLVGIHAHQMRRLQSVLNAAARLVLNLKRSDHNHHRRTRQPGPGAQYKIVVLSYKVLTLTLTVTLGLQAHRISTS